ncbi:hypothetical protein Tco_0491680 [Tanacetum coccineum]
MIGSATTLVLSTEGQGKILPEHPIHVAWVKGQKEVAVLMLLTMDLDIQRNLAHLGAYDMLQELKAMFSKQAEQELLQTHSVQPLGSKPCMNELYRPMLNCMKNRCHKKVAYPARHAIPSRKGFEIPEE